jgi:hypothetical protein
MTEYGIFSEAAGGCIESGLYSVAEGEERRAKLVAEGEDAGDLAVKEMCPDHEEQPKDGCEECADEDDEEADEN